MEKFLRIDTVHQYNEYVGVETLHPLVSVIDLSKCKPFYYKHIHCGLYCVFLKDVSCGPIKYGLNYYDYQDGTIVTTAPAQSFGIESKEPTQPKGWALVFHPDLIYGTELGRTIKDYKFFSYDSNEALHLSEKERDIIIHCFQNIHTELERDIDQHTNKVLAGNIALLLDYCVRFYDRQFITRHKVNSDILSRFETLLDDYLRNGEARESGLPSVAFCADKLCLSANYFGDLIKKETGKTAQEYIQLKLVDLAKEKLAGTNRSIADIAEELGFKYATHFTRLFKKQVGLSPIEYRMSC